MHKESQQRPPTAADCPPSEELACLVDGVLSHESAEATLGHILACPKCYEVYIGLLHFQLASPREDSEQARGNVVSLPPLPLPATSRGETNRPWGSLRLGTSGRPGSEAMLLQKPLHQEGFTLAEASEALRLNKCYEFYVGLLRLQLASPSEDSGQARGNVASLPPLPLPATSRGDTSRYWGRFRMGAPRRPGLEAMLLEQLLHQDGFTFHEACEALRTNHGCTASDEELEAYRAALSPRMARPLVAVEHLYSAPSLELSPEEAAMAKENASRGAKILSCVQEAVHSLPTDERLFVRLHFVEGLKISEIARIHNLDRKDVRASLDKSLRFLREYLMGLGVSEQDSDSFLPLSFDSDGVEFGGDGD